MKSNIWPVAALLIFRTLAGPAPLRADSLDVELQQSTLTVAAGTTVVTFDATITNDSPTDTIYLNGDSSSTSSTLLSVDDTPYFINAPFFLAPGQGSGLIALFNVDLDPSTPVGTYTGNVFSILGGADGGTGTAFDDLADAYFSVNVTGEAVPTPEPTTILLAMLGILAVGIIIGGEHVRKP